MGQFYSGMSFGYHRGCGGEDRGECCRSWSPLSITSLTLCMILWCPWVVPSVKDWYIHCVRRSAITGPSFQQQLDCLIAIKTVVWLYFFVVLVEYAVTSEFPLCGIKKSLSNQISGFVLWFLLLFRNMKNCYLVCWGAFLFYLHFFRWSTVTRPVRSCTGLAIKRSVRCYRSRERNTNLSLHHDYRNRPKVFKRTALLWH